MVDIGGYVIVLVEQDDKIKLFGKKSLFSLFPFSPLKKKYFWIISLGSPADRNDCDEILEINGHSLERLSHQEIIDYILEVSNHFSLSLSLSLSLSNDFFCTLSFPISVTNFTFSHMQDTFFSFFLLSPFPDNFFPFFFFFSIFLYFSFSISLSL